MQFGKRYFQDRPPGLSRGDRYRLLAMVILLLGLVVGIFWLGREPGPPERPPAEVGKLPDRDPDGPGGKPHEVRPDPAEPFVEREEALRDIKDETAELEPKPLLYVLHRVVTTSQEELARRKDLPWPSQKEVLGNPERYRGKFIYLPGRVVSDLFPRAVPEGEGLVNRSGVHTYYDAFIEDKNRNWFRILLSTKDREYADGEGVVVRGIFLKSIRYTTRDGREAEVPLVVAQRFEPLPEPDRTISGLLEVGIAFFALLALLFAGSLVIARRSDRKFREDLRELRGRTRSRAGAPAPEDPSQGTPPAGGP